MGKLPRLVILESPYRGETERHLFYAVEAISDCLRRGEAPLASHVTYTASLDDGDPLQRQIGIDAGHAWMRHADALVAYVDMGISEGMEAGINKARAMNIPVEFRHIRATTD